MFFLYSNGTTCIRSDDLDVIEQAVSRIFEQEGCRRIPLPPLPQDLLPSIEKRLWLFQDIQPYLWVIGLFIGNLGWTVVKTSPSGLLNQRAKGAIRPRLSELAMQSGCDAFYYMVYADPSSWGALLEADASGQTFVSGCLDCYDDEKKMKFGDEPITELSGGLNFYLLWPFTRPVHYQQPRAGEIKDVTTRGAVMDDEDDEFNLNELPF